MSQHLSDMEVEALATGRMDLVSEVSRTHLAECALCQQRVQDQERSVRDADAGLARLLPALSDVDGTDLGAMIRRAVQDARHEAAAEPTPASLKLGMKLGLAVLGFGAVSLALRPAGGWPFGTPGAAVDSLWSAIRAADVLVAAFVPGGWSAFGLACVGVSALLLWPIHRLMRPGERISQDLSQPVGRASTLWALGWTLLLTTGPTARAYELEGSWPEPTPLVSLEVERVPLSVALAKVTAEAGFSVVAQQLAVDPLVSLRVHEQPLPEVIDALLADSGVATLRVRGRLITVRNGPSPPEVEAAGRRDHAARGRAEAEAQIARRTGIDLAAELGSRSSFGEDVVVSVHERVRGVATMGGDALIRGEVLGDVATAGGDVHISGRVAGDVVTMGGDARIIGEVIGDVVTMGGDIDVSDDASVHGSLAAMGGDVRDRRAEAGRGARNARIDHSFVRRVLVGLVHSALVFLVGLTLQAGAGRRFRNVQARLSARPFHSLLLGMLGCVAFAATTCVLLISLIGIPAAVVFGVLLAVSLLIGLAAAAGAVGAWLPKAAARMDPRLGLARLLPVDAPPVRTLAVGVVAFFLAGLVPFLGGWVWWGAVFAGLGSLVWTRFGERRPETRPPVMPAGPFRSSARNG